jgi:hypothetical protein
MNILKLIKQAIYKINIGNFIHKKGFLSYFVMQQGQIKTRKLSLIILDNKIERYLLSSLSLLI